MKVFVSWSGGASHEVAKAIKEWLPNVIQAVDVFLSSEDIAKGAQWFHELSKVLDECEFGILCLTRSNLSEPWILYEAGALSKRFEGARIVPLLIDLKIEDLNSPLANFNASLLDRAEFEKLAAEVNRAAAKRALTEKQLTNAFNGQWPTFEKALDLAVRQVAADSGFVYDVFLSTPMAAYQNDAEYAAERLQIKKLFDSLTGRCGLKVYWAAEKIESMSDFDTLDVSVLDDLKALQTSRTFSLIYTKRLATSALFEAGYALALKRVSHYFVRDRDDLPFLMRELAGPAGDLVRIHSDDDWRDFDDLADKMFRYKDRWFA